MFVLSVLTPQARDAVLYDKAALSSNLMCLLQRWAGK